MNWLSMLAGQGGQMPAMDDPYSAQMALQNAQMDKQRAQQMMQPQYQGGGKSGILAGLLSMLGGNALNVRADETAAQALKRTFEFDNAAAARAAEKAAADDERKFQRELERDRKKAEAVAKNRAPTELQQLLGMLPEDQRARAAQIKAGLLPQAQAPQQPRQPSDIEIKIQQARALGATNEQLQQLVLGAADARATPERRETAKLNTARIKDAEERARAAEKTLANVAQLEKLMEGGLATGPMDQFLPGADRGLFDSIASDLNLSTLRQNFGGNPTEGERAANAATLPGKQQYEQNNRQLLAKLRAEAEQKIAEYQQLTSGGQAAPAQQSGGWGIQRVD